MLIFSGSTLESAPDLEVPSSSAGLPGSSSRFIKVGREQLYIIYLVGTQMVADVDVEPYTYQAVSLCILIVHSVLMDLWFGYITFRGIYVVLSRICP